MKKPLLFLLMGTMIIFSGCTSDSDESGTDAGEFPDAGDGGSDTDTDTDSDTDSDSDSDAGMDASQDSGDEDAGEDGGDLPGEGMWTIIPPQGDAGIEPPPTQGASLVWTGDKAILWGGFARQGPVNAGYAYDPESESWSRITSTDAPDGRWRHFAAWTGSSMLVFGGRNDMGQIMNSGGLYDPGKDEWTDVRSQNAPEGALGQGIVLADDSLVVWGGMIASDAVNTGAVYDIKDGKWTALPLADAPDARYDHVMIWTGDSVIVWGGRGTDGAVLSTGAALDPDSMTWTSLSATDAAEGRISGSAAWLSDSMVVWGGIKPGTGGAVESVRSAAEYDPSDDEWSAVSVEDAPQGRYANVVLASGGNMFIWGGQNATGDLMDSGGVYLSGQDSWVRCTKDNGPGSRLNMAAALIKAGSDNGVMIWGGSSGDFDHPLLGDGAIFFHNSL